MAGGMDLLALMKDYVAQPERLVNVKNLDKTIAKTAEGGLRIGAAVTIADLAVHPDVTRMYPAIVQAAAEVGTPQIRNAGTVGGNINQRPRCWYFRNEEFPCLKKGGSTCYAVDGENQYHAIFGDGPCHIVHPSSLARSEEHTSELQSPCNLVCRLLLEKKKKYPPRSTHSPLLTVAPRLRLPLRPAPPTTAPSPLPLHDALPIFRGAGTSATRSFPASRRAVRRAMPWTAKTSITPSSATAPATSSTRRASPDRKSTRLNSSHLVISYAVFCLKKKKNIHHEARTPPFSPSLPAFASLSALPPPPPRPPLSPYTTLFRSSAVLVLPQRGVSLPQEGRFDVLCRGRRKPVSRHLRRRPLPHRPPVEPRQIGRAHV